MYNSKNDSVLFSKHNAPKKIKNRKMMVLFYHDPIFWTCTVTAWPSWKPLSNCFLCSTLP